MRIADFRERDLNHIKKEEIYSIESVLEKYRLPLLRYFYWNTNNYEDSQDLFQEISIKIYRNIENFRGEASLSTWIYKIASNTLVEYYRQKKKKKGLLFDNYEEINLFRDDRISFEQEFLEKETCMEIWEIIHELPADFKRVYLLKEMFNFSCQEISEILDIPIGTVLSRLYRASKKLISLYNSRFNDKL